MKRFVPFLKAMAFAYATIFATFTVSAQFRELVFNNPSLVAGTAGADGAVYRFPGVTNNVDALVTIVRRSSSQVTLTSIDLTTTGFRNALQPQVRFGSSTISGIQNWWMEFELRFVNAGTNNPISLNSFKLTALDIDGNNDKLREWVAFRNFNHYKLEANSGLLVSDLVTTLFTGKQFTGVLQERPGIDTTATDMMVTLTYLQTGIMNFRLGGLTTGTTAGSARMYSLWFRDFEYQQPIVLPVKLVRFEGHSNNQKITLSWTVDMNEDADYYELEKSTNGRDFKSVALIFPTNQTGRENYSYSTAAPTQGTEMYRLKLIDKNGTISYSRILTFQAGGTQVPNALRIMGNPAGVQLNFSYQTNNRQITLRVLNMNGTCLLQKNVATMAGTNLIGVDISALTSGGMYILEVLDNGVRTSSRFLK